MKVYTAFTISETLGTNLRVYEKKFCWPVEIKYNSTDRIAFHVLGHAFSIGYNFWKDLRITKNNCQIKRRNYYCMWESLNDKELLGSGIAFEQVEVAEGLAILNKK